MTKDEYLVVMKKLDEIIRKISYKPGTKFDVREVRHGVAELMVSQRVPDAHTEVSDYIHGLISIPIRVLVADGYDQILQVIRNGLINMEIHEMDEWIRFNGVQVFDPHKEEKRERKGT